MRHELLFAMPLLLLHAQELPYKWNATGALVTARHHACAAPLAGGRVLVTGGVGPEGTALASAEIYNSAEGTFSAAAPMSAERVGHSCSALADGRILVVGDGAAELFEPATGKWKATEGVPAVARRSHSATVLADGSVLLSGGLASESGAAVPALERFDPVTGRFALLETALASARSGHAAALLGDGRRVAIIGGEGLDTIEIVDAIEQTVQTGPALPRALQRHTATALLDGRVLIAGGRETPDAADSNETLLLSAAGDALERGPNMAVARSSAQAVRLAGNGSVLVIGGVAGDTPLASTEMLDAEAKEWAAFGSLTLAREGLAVSPIGDSGSVLSAGGMLDGGMAIAACGKASADSIRSNAASYLQGDTATITGTWLEKETVRVVATFTNVAGAVVSERTVVANNTTGTFTVTFNNLTAGTNVRVRASGDTSLNVAITTFPVSSQASLLLSVSPASPVAAPVRPTVTVRVRPALGGMGAPEGFLTLRDGDTVLAVLLSSSASAYQFASNGDGVFTWTPVGMATGSHSFSASFIRTGGFVDSAVTSAPASYGIIGGPLRMFIAINGDISDALIIADATGAPLQGKTRIQESLHITGALAIPPGGPRPTGKFSVSERFESLPPFQVGDAVAPTEFTSVKGGFFAAALGFANFSSDRSTRFFDIKYAGDLYYPPLTQQISITPAGLRSKIQVDSVTGPDLSPTFRINDPLVAKLTFTQSGQILPNAGTCPPNQSTCPSGLEMKWTRDNDGGFVPFAAAVQNPPTTAGPVTWSFSGALLPFKTAGVHTLKFRYEGHYYYDDLDIERQVTVGKGLPVKNVTATTPNPGIATIVVDLNSACLLEATTLGGLTCITNNAPDGIWRILEDKTEVATASAALRMTFNLQAAKGPHTYTLFYAGNSQWEGVSLPVKVAVP